MTDSELVAAIRRWQPNVDLSANHRYRVMVNGKWDYAQGVTTVIKSTLAAPALLDWAARMAYEHQDPKAHIKVRDEAADKGTNLHSLIERECRLMMGEMVVDLPATEDELMALARWRRWAKDADFRPIAAEFRVYHPALNYAGTVDVLGYVRGALKVLDWKSTTKATASPYAEHYLQNAAYRSALSIMVGVEPPGGHLVRIPRDGDVATEWPVSVSLEETQKAFEALLCVHLWKRTVNKKGEAA